MRISLRCIAAGQPNLLLDVNDFVLEKIFNIGAIFSVPFLVGTQPLVLLATYMAVHLLVLSSGFGNGR